MSLYIPTIPTPSDNLDFSQGQLLQNFGALDTYFGIDHVKFSVNTNNGFHNKVTTVPAGSIPVTAANPVLYAYSATVNLGALQYSKGPTDPVATPLTSLHSTVGAISIPANTSIILLDFAGINLAFLNVYATATGSITGNLSYLSSSIVWSGSAFIFKSNVSGNLEIGSTLGTKIFLSSLGEGANNLYWTMSFERIQ